MLPNSEKKPSRTPRSPPLPTPPRFPVAAIPAAARLLPHGRRASSPWPACHLAPQRSACLAPPPPAGAVPLPRPGPGLLPHAAADNCLDALAAVNCPGASPPPFLTADAQPSRPTPRATLEPSPAHRRVAAPRRSSTSR
ncbi:hypothetical protein ACQJBY_015569 [Aegilops geniculata]